MGSQLMYQTPESLAFGDTGNATPPTEYVVEGSNMVGGQPMYQRPPVADVALAPPPAIRNRVLSGGAAGPWIHFAACIKCEWSLGRESIRQSWSERAGLLEEREAPYCHHVPSLGSWLSQCGPMGGGYQQIGEQGHQIRTQHSTA